MGKLKVVEKFKEIKYEWVNWPSQSGWWWWRVGDVEQVVLIESLSGSNSVVARIHNIREIVTNTGLQKFQPVKPPSKLTRIYTPKGGDDVA